MNPALDVEEIEHLLQRAVEGGHWMITPPRLLSLVHAVQQPIGVPEFTAISVQHVPYGTPPNTTRFCLTRSSTPIRSVLQTAPEDQPTEESELAAHHRLAQTRLSQEAFLLGGLKIHAASTEKVDLLAEWTDPVRRRRPSRA